MALSGSLLDFNATDILQLIKMQAKTGVLTVVSRTSTLSFSFQDGDLVFADSPDTPFLDQLGRRMVREGGVSGRAWQRAVDKFRSDGTSLDRGLESASDEAQALLLEQVDQYRRNAMFSLFGWLEGDYTFSGDATLPLPVTAALSAIDTHDILMEASQRADEWPLIEQHISNGNQIFHNVAGDAPALDATEGVDGLPGWDVLSAKEQHILQLVDGHRDVWEIHELSRYDGFTSSKSLAGLLEKGMIAQSGVSQRKAAQAAPVVAVPDAPASHRARRGSPVLVSLLCVLVMALCLGLVVGMGSVATDQASTGLLASTASYRDHNVRQAIKVYRLVYGRFPDSLQTLQKEGLVDAVATVGLVYKRTADGFSLHHGPQSS